MSNKLKVILGISSGVMVLLIGLLFLVNVVYEPEPEKLIFPTGELSDSIFVGQNNIYTPNEALDKTHDFETVPYKVDVPESQGAKIGSGCVYDVGGDMFVYVTEFDDMTQVEEGHYDKVVQMQDILSSQFPSALLINYIPEETKVTAEVSGDGFINGFTAHYLADSIGITDGAQIVNSALLGYILDIDKKGFEGRHLYVSVGTKDPTNTSLQNSATVLSAVMQTLRFDEETYKDMLAKMGLTEEDLAEGEEKTEEVAEDGGEEMLEVSDDGADDSVYEKRIYCDQEDAELQVNVSWENPNPGAILELFLPGEEQFCEPLNSTDTSAQFVLVNAPMGEYVLRIKNYKECGEISDGTSSVGNAGDGYDSEGTSSDYGTDYDSTSTGTDYDSASTGTDGGAMPPVADYSTQAKGNGFSD